MSVNSLRGICGVSPGEEQEGCSGKDLQDYSTDPVRHVHATLAEYNKRSKKQQDKNSLA